MIVPHQFRLWQAASCEIADFGHESNGDKKRHTPQGLLSRDQACHGPGRYDFTQLLLQGHQPILCGINHFNLILEDDLLRRDDRTFVP
jgi:hypothetical protein